jgi:hypothetical protein
MLMMRISWSVHFNMEKSVEPVQNVEEKTLKETKKRSQADKVGKLKYLLQKIYSLERSIDEIKLMQRTILAGLKPSFDFEQSLIEKLACSDEVDKAILQLLFEAGGTGLLPKDLASKLAEFKVARLQVSRRIIRMNKRLVKELGSPVAEQRGWHWAMTGFAVEAFRESSREDLPRVTPEAGSWGNEEAIE